MAQLTITGGHLLEHIAFKASPNVGRVIVPTLLVYHYTAATTAASSINWLTTAVSKASAHLIIDIDGTITQLVPFNYAAWHAGLSRYEGRPKVNGFSIGVELVNPGPLTYDSHQRLTTLRGERWRGAAVTAPHDHLSCPYTLWAAYARAQLASLIDVSSVLALRYGIQQVTGHSDITTRKLDPGPAFPMGEFRALVQRLTG
jgi:N-acetylmuramoyl-L-alanine amidase